jgi:DNA-binding response OmpR family regulator
MIEDDHRLAGMVSAYLTPQGYGVDVAPDAASGLALLADCAYDLILLDLMLPDADGLDVCRAIRGGGAARGNVPVIMVTARGDAMDRVLGLELGADDYLAKPFEPRELLARVRAVLRRTLVDRQRPQSELLQFGRLEIDRGTREVRLDQQVRTLTSLQFDLLVVMAQNAGRVLSRESLLQHVRGESFDAFDRSIDVHIGKIRSAIEDDVRFPKRIITVRGVGYVFSKVQASETR